MARPARALWTLYDLLQSLRALAARGHLITDRNYKDGAIVSAHTGRYLVQIYRELIRIVFTPEPRRPEHRLPIGRFEHS